MAEPESIESRIDRLLSKDFMDLTTDQVLQTITGGQDLSLPYQDLQSEDGFDAELEKTKKEVDGIIESLKPQPLPIPLSTIEDLSCNYEGDSLYGRVLLETLKQNKPDIYKELIESGEWRVDPVSPKDIGVVTTFNTLIPSTAFPSKGIASFFEKKDPEFFARVNESLFDNLDPIILGKPTNAGSRKKRKLKILGFEIFLEFIMLNNQIEYVKLGASSDLSIEEAISRVEGIMKEKNKNSKPCDFDNSNEIDKEYLLGQGFSNKEIDFINNEKKNVMDRLKKYFSIYFFSSVFYCCTHTFKFYRKDLPLRKSLYPFGFLLGTFYLFTIYAMKTFNQKLSHKIKIMLYNKYSTNLDLNHIEQNMEFLNNKDLIENQMKFTKFYHQRNPLINKFI